jgi:RNA polymerase sigma-70 factor (ECF subfamily)
MDVAQDVLVSAADLEGLYREHGARLWRALVAYAGDRDIANDAVAEAFAQALGRGDELREPIRWIWRAAFRIAAGELKERNRRGNQAAVDPAYELPEAAGQLIAALERLSPNQRAALVLHYYGGYPTKEIAEILGASVATVRVHLSQGRKRLRRILEDDDAGA